MKKKIIIICLVVLLILLGTYAIKNTKQNEANSSEKQKNSQETIGNNSSTEESIKGNTEDNTQSSIQNNTEGINTVLTLEDEINNNSIWCGTFQLIWNDLKDQIAKQDIVFTPQLKVVENLNKETFKTSDISDKYYYKKIGTPTPELKKEIEKAIKDKFNEESKILNDFNWNSAASEDNYFLYAMLKKEFQFKKAFDELDKGKFNDTDNIKYFGLKSKSEEEQRNQITVMYYNSSNDFAIKLYTKQEDEVILCKNPNGKTFNEIYNNIQNNEKNFTGDKNVEEGELVKIPNIKIDEKSEFGELQGKPFYFSNGNSYLIDKAIQTIEFELDKTGGKIKSEAGMSVMKSSIALPEEKREFIFDNTFAIFLKENDKNVPYFAGKIDDMSKFQ